MQKYSILPQFAVDNPGETARIGCMVAATGYHLQGITRDGRGLVGRDPLTYGAMRSAAVQKQGTAQALLAEVRVYAEQNDLDLVGWNPDTKVATFAILTPVVRAIRKRWAEVLGVQPHDIDIFAEYAADEPRLERIVARVPSKTIAADRRAGILTELASAIPGYTSGWAIEENALTGRVDFTYGVADALPRRVSVADILPLTVTPKRWDFSCFGMNARGVLAGHDLSASPHVLIGGSTNTGKTVAITSMLASRLMHGHDVIILDPIKGVDFEAFRPFARFIAETYEESLSGMEWVLAEAQRRKAVLKAHRAVKMQDLPDEVRAAEGIKPLTIVVDELGQLFSIIKPNAALPKDDPTRLAQEALAIQKALLDAGTGEIARAYRFVGLYLVLATQKLLVSMLGANGSDLRSNCGNAVYLHRPGAAVERGDISLAFDSATDRVIERIDALDDKVSPGLAVTIAETGGIDAIRVAYSTPADVEALLRARGVPIVTPLNPGAAPAPAAPVAASPAPVEPAAEQWTPPSQR